MKAGVSIWLFYEAWQLGPVLPMVDIHFHPWATVDDV